MDGIFLRRIDRNRKMPEIEGQTVPKSMPKPRRVADEAFIDKNNEVSLHRVPDEFVTNGKVDSEWLDKYVDWRLPSGDKPGVCFVTGQQLASLGIEPTEDKSSSAPFGQIHYVMPNPSDPAKLAAMASQNGILRRIEKS